MTAQIPSSAQRLLRIREAAAYLGISRKKLRALVQRRAIPLVRFGDNAVWLLDMRDLDRFIERSKSTL